MVGRQTYVKACACILLSCKRLPQHHESKCSPATYAEKIDRGQATLGQFDGQRMSLACGTLAGKVFIHSPHQQAVSDSNISYLNINKKITALTSGNLAPSKGPDARDTLLVGTATSLQCYDVDRCAAWLCYDVDRCNGMTISSQLAAVSSPPAVQCCDADRCAAMARPACSAMTWTGAQQRRRAQVRRWYHQCGAVL